MPAWHALRSEWPFIIIIITDCQLAGPNHASHTIEISARGHGSTRRQDNITHGVHVLGSSACLVVSRLVSRVVYHGLQFSVTMVYVFYTGSSAWSTFWIW